MAVAEAFTTTTKHLLYKFGNYETIEGISRETVNVETPQMARSCLQSEGVS